MASIEMSSAGAPSKSASQAAGVGGGVDVDPGTGAMLQVQHEPHFKRSLCCAYTLHIFSAGILGHVYAGA